MNVFNLLTALATTLPKHLELKLKTQLKIRCCPAQPQLVQVMLSIPFELAEVMFKEV